MQKRSGYTYICENQLDSEMGLLMTDYIPYGLPHATSASPTTNRRKFGGKELATDLGLNLHDFTARWQNPALGRFTTPDPLSEKYCHISLYSFCAGDPINYIDPTGMFFDLSNLTDEELDLWNKKVSELCTSPLFNTMYNQLLESVNMYTVDVVNEFNTKDICQAMFIEAEDGSGGEIKLLSSAFQSDNRNNVVEELFHAYQSETIYDGEINREFEARIFVDAFIKEFGWGPQPGADGILEIYRKAMDVNIDSTLPVLNEISLSSPLYREQFIFDTYKFVEYNRTIGVTNPNYYTISTCYPAALINLHNKTYGK